MNIISSGFPSTNFREVFSFANPRESCSAIVFGIATYALADYYRRHNFYCISDRNKLAHYGIDPENLPGACKDNGLVPYYPKIAALAAVSAVGVGILAIGTYPRFKVHYITFAQALAIPFLNTLKCVALPAIGVVGGGLFLLSDTYSERSTKIIPKGGIAEILTPIIPGVLGLVATGFLVKRFPLQTISLNQTTVLLIANITLGILGLPYESTAKNNEDGDPNWVSQRQHNYNQRKWLDWGKKALLFTTGIGVLTSPHKRDSIRLCIKIFATLFSSKNT